MTRVPIAAVLVVAAGCGRGDPSRVHPVAGRIEVSDRPAGNVHVVFHPVDRDRTHGAFPVGVSRPDGTFTLTTHAAGDGAPEGEYVVTVFWPNEALPIDECNCPDRAKHDRLGGLYFDPGTSQLRAAIHPGTNEITLRPAIGGGGWNLPPLAPRADAQVRPERERPAAGTHTMSEREKAEADAHARARAERERAGGGPRVPQ
ncbi:MAG TPA: hypothetical protein VH092_28780 [Urbifossiella sp.]|jgi:hypothetical protein|nr:hypothetical protein [Urbifossiella sp.]